MVSSLIRQWHRGGKNFKQFLWCVKYKMFSYSIYSFCPTWFSFKTILIVKNGKGIPFIMQLMQGLKNVPYV